MRGLSRVVIVGRLGKDPELRTSRSAQAFATMSVATNRPKRDGEAWVEETDWHDVLVFGEDAVRCQKRLKPGSVVAIEGSLVYESWLDEGVRRRKAKIVANRVQFVSDLRPVGAEGGAEGGADEPPSAESDAAAEATVEATLA
ncbi:MAG: single-stranded DNA-binding protein [Myxococcota bacterium]